MRKIFSTVMLVAAAAMTFASCQREEMNAPKETFSTTLTLNTEVDATKTYLGADNTVLWGENESVTLFVKDSNEEPATTFVKSASTSDFNGKASASFTFELTGIAESASYTIGGIYPESVFNGIDNKNAAAYKINLPATQNASVDNYDPSAFIMVLKPETVETVPSTYTASFCRAVALNKVTLTGVKENISSVEITVEPSQEGLYLAGRRYVDLTTAEFGDIYYGQTNTVTVNAPYTGSSIDVWFTSWGMDLKSGDKLTVKMTSATKTYTRTITANENGIKFVEGDLNTLKVNMASAEEVVLENLSGKYLVVGKKNDNWSLMAPTASNYIEAYATTVAATNTACAAFYEIANIESYVWTATAVDGGYTLSSYDGKFVSYPNNGENHANLVQSSVTLGLDIDDTQKATVIDMVSGRALKYNASSPRFAFYPSGQTDIYFIPWVADTTPRIFVTSEHEQSIGADGGEVKIEYTLKNLDGMTLTVEEDSDFVSASVAAGVVTVTVDANEATESRSATLTLKCGEAAPVSVTINQAGKQAAGVTKQYYVKVTTAPNDWSGTYLMVCDSKKMVLSGISTTSTKYGIGTAVDITDNKIEATETLASYQVVLSPGSTSGSYLMKFNGSYLYWNSGNSLATNANNNSNTNWLLSASDGNVTIKNCKDNTRVIVWNASSPRFACYTSTQTAIQLYKLEDGNAGGETPTPDPEPENPTPDQPSSGSAIEFTFTSNAAVSKDGVTVTFAKGNGQTAPAWNTSSNHLRLYASNTIVVSAPTKTITKIEYVFTKQGDKVYATASGGTSYTSGGTSTSSNDPKTDTWIGTVTNSSVTVTLGASGQRVIKSIKVYTN